MPKFSTRSSTRLSTCDIRLQNLFKEVVRTYDCTILVGHRTEIDQNNAYNSGNSKLKWPESKHNSMPSKAVDVAPYPIDWGDTGSLADRAKAIARFYHFAGYVLRTAEDLGIPIRWGGDWDMDKDFSDQTFNDLVHWELLE